MYRDIVYLVYMSVRMMSHECKHRRGRESWKQFQLINAHATNITQNGVVVVVVHYDVFTLQQLLPLTLINLVTPNFSV